MEPLYEKLQENFELKPRQISIIKVLQNKRLDANEICKLTDIPKGKIYDYINGLLKNKLIERTEKKPFVYSLPDLNQNVLRFMKHKIDSVIDAQREVIDIMKGKGLEQVELITDSRKFTQIHLNMVSESKIFQYVSLHGSVPYVLYPFDYEKFIRLRKAVSKSRTTITYTDHEIAMLICRSYQDALEHGKEIDVILEKDALIYQMNVIKKELGKKFFNDWKKTVIEQLKKYKIKVKLLDEYIPMQIDVNEIRVNLSIKHLGITNGIVIQSREAAGFYTEVFNQMSERGEDALPIIKKTRA